MATLGISSRPYVPSTEEVLAAMQSLTVRDTFYNAGASPMAQSGQFTTDMVRAALVRKTKRTVNAAVVHTVLVAHCRAGTVKGYFYQK